MNRLKLRSSHWFTWKRCNGRNENNDQFCWFHCWKNSPCFCLNGLINTSAIDVKMNGSDLEEKLFFKMLGLSFSSKLVWGSYIISIAKTASKKIGVLICSMRFLSLEVTLYLYKSSIRPCMEYCCYLWDGAHSCYLKMLDRLQKRIWRTIGPSFSISPEPLAHRRNVFSLSLFSRYYLGRCLSNLIQLVPLHFLE